MCEQEPAFFDLVLELIPGVYLKDIFVTKGHRLLIDVLLYLFQQQCYVFRDAFDRM